MEKAIGVLQTEINEKVDRLIEYESKNSYDTEYIAECKESIQKLRRAVVVLKYFSVDDVIKELLKKE